MTFTSASQCFFSLLDETGRLEVAAVGCFPSTGCNPSWLGFCKIVSLWAGLLKNRDFSYFSNGYFACSLPGTQGAFSPLYTVGTCRTPGGKTLKRVEASWTGTPWLSIQCRFSNPSTGSQRGSDLVSTGSLYPHVCLSNFGAEVCPVTSML